MKRHAGKTGILILALIVALGGTGAAFAAWTDIITIQGTITTATIDWELTDVTFSWECEPRSETAWAIADRSFEYEYQGGGWGQYFTYNIGDTVTVPLYAAQTELVGEVRISTQTVGDDDYLIVEYDTTAYGWEMTETHVYVGADPPLKLAPGSFPYGHDPLDPAVTSDQYSIPLEWSGDVYIAAHAVVTDGSSDCGVQTWTTVDHSVVVTLTGVPAGSSGQLCFNIHNIGTIPIRISNIVIDSPAGVTVLLVPPDPTGTQLHPGESLPVPVCVSILVTSSGTYTVTITVDAVQWNMY